MNQSPHLTKDRFAWIILNYVILSSLDVNNISEMNITGTLPQAGNLKLFVPSLSTQSSTRPKQNMFNVVCDRTKLNEKRILRRCKTLIRLKLAE